MKPYFALLFIFASATVFASVDQCESNTQQSAPAMFARKALRIKHKMSAEPVVGPILHPTPYIPVRPFPTSSPIKITAISKFNCLTPISMPPGAIRVGYSIPYIGPRPEWGNPTPSYLATGPMPVRPGSPDDFRPAAYAPPGFVPPVANELPEPPTVALMFLGVVFLIKKARVRA